MARQLTIRTMAVWLGLAALAPGAKAQTAGTCVGQTALGGTVLVQLDADGDGLVWSWDEPAYPAACEDGAQRAVDHFFPVFEPITGRTKWSDLRVNLFAESMSLRFDADGRSVEGRVRSAVPMLKGRRHAQVWVLAPQIYTAPLQRALGGATRAPAFHDRRQSVPAAVAAAAAAPRPAVTITFNGSTSQGDPLTVKLSVDENGSPVRQFFFYPPGWDTVCQPGGTKAECGAFYANREMAGDRMRFTEDDDQHRLRGDMRLSDGGSVLTGQLELTAAQVADVEHSLHKAASCLTGPVSVQATASTAQQPH